MLKKIIVIQHCYLPDNFDKLPHLSSTLDEIDTCQLFPVDNKRRKLFLSLSLAFSYRRLSTNQREENNLFWKWWFSLIFNSNI
jgi:hypothetical protein